MKLLGFELCINTNFITDYEEEIQNFYTFHDGYHHMILLTIRPGIKNFRNSADTMIFESMKGKVNETVLNLAAFDNKKLEQF